MIKKSLTWLLLIKIIVGVGVGVFFLKSIWPAKPRNVVVGQGELETTERQTERQTETPEPQPETTPETTPVARKAKAIAVQMPFLGADGVIDSVNSVVAQARPAVIKVIVLSAKNTNTNVNTKETGIKMGDAYIVSPDQTVGSGVIINSKGLFLTTSHVVGENNDLQVSLYRAGQNQYTARVIARDPDSPLVLGKIRAPAHVSFPFVRMGDSDRLRTGDLVLVVGNPFALSGTVTSGIVSGKKDVTVDGVVVENAILTDATINDGNAGGALINMDGQVVGIAFADYVQNGSFTGIGFAVPVNFAKEAWTSAGTGAQ